MLRKNHFKKNLPEAVQTVQKAHPDATIEVWGMDKQLPFPTLGPHSSHDRKQTNLCFILTPYLHSRLWMSRLNLSKRVIQFFSAPLAAQVWQHHGGVVEELGE